MKVLKIAIATGLLFSTSTQASDFFVEASAGASLGTAKDFSFLNPTGAGATSNATSGNFIIMDNVDDNDTSFSGGIALGYKPADKWVTKLAINYFGEFDVKGDATFGGTAYDQDLNIQATGYTVGLGYQFDLTDKFFLEPNVEAGLAVVKTKGRQGANVGASGTFPSETHNNFAAGLGINAGYKISEKFTVLSGLNYYWLGDADTGVTGNPAPAGMNSGEQLQADLEVATFKVALRYNF